MMSHAAPRRGLHALSLETRCPSASFESFLSYRRPTLKLKWLLKSHLSLMKPEYVFRSVPFESTRMGCQKILVLLSNLGYTFAPTRYVNALMLKLLADWLLLAIRVSWNLSPAR